MIQNVINSDEKTKEFWIENCTYDDNSQLKKNNIHDSFKSFCNDANQMIKINKEESDLEEKKETPNYDFYNNPINSDQQLIELFMRYCHKKIKNKKQRGTDEDRKVRYQKQLDFLQEKCPVDANATTQEEPVGETPEDRKKRLDQVKKRAMNKLKIISMIKKLKNAKLDEDDENAVEEANNEFFKVLIVEKEFKRSAAPSSPSSNSNSNSSGSNTSGSSNPISKEITVEQCKLVQSCFCHVTHPFKNKVISEQFRYNKLKRCITQKCKDTPGCKRNMPEIHPKFFYWFDNTTVDKKVERKLTLDDLKSIQGVNGENENKQCETAGDFDTCV